MKAKFVFQWSKNKHVLGQQRSETKTLGQNCHPLPDITKEEIDELVRFFDFLGGSFFDSLGTNL